MAKRPRTHVIEDLARAKIIEAFSALGWSVEEIKFDYGEDYIVQLFEKGVKTEKFFHVQSKATDSIGHYHRRNSRNIHYPVKRSSLISWQRYLAPVIFTVYDVKGGTVYWEYIDKKPLKRAGLFPVVQLDTRNTFDEGGLARLRQKILSRYHELEAQTDGASIIVKALKEHLSLDIVYEPEGGLLQVPRGSFHPSSKGGGHLVLFGPLGAELERMSARLGLAPESIVKNGLHSFEQVIDAFEKGGQLKVQGADGKILQEFKTLDEFLDYLEFEGARRAQ